jgi:hypothetical protein
MLNPCRSFFLLITSTILINFARFGPSDLFFLIPVTIDP